MIALPAAPTAGATAVPRAERWGFLALACGLLVIVAAYPSLPPGIRNWDNVVKLQVAQSMLSGRGPVLTAAPPSEDYVVRGKDGRPYGPYPPMAPALHFLTIGAMWLGAAPTEGVPALTLLALLAVIVVIWGHRSGVSPTAAVAGAMLVVFGTALWPMAAHGYDIVIEALALAVILLASSGSAATGSWCWAGLAVGAAFATRLGAAILVVPAGVCILGQDPHSARRYLARALWFTTGCLPGILLVLWHNWLRFGSPFTVFQPNSMGRSIGDLVVPWFSEFHWQAMLGLTVSPGKGIVWYGPPIIGVLAFALPLARRFGLALAAVAIYLLVAVVLFGRLLFWHGEWGWGPRYVAPAYVICAPLAWWVTEYVIERGRAWSIAAMLALATFIAIQVVPVVGYPVESQLGRIITPLWNDGRLATASPLHPPVVADNFIYFEPDWSMIVTTARAVRDTLDRRSTRLNMLGLIALALLPAGASIGAVFAANLFASEARRRGRHHVAATHSTSSERKRTRT